jgi:hypothetical protein
MAASAGLSRIPARTTARSASWIDTRDTPIASAPVGATGTSTTSTASTADRMTPRSSVGVSITTCAKSSARSATYLCRSRTGKLKAAFRALNGSQQLR